MHSAREADSCCGRRSSIDWLANLARTYVFSTAQPAATSAAALAALDIVRDEPKRREQLLAAAAESPLALRDRAGIRQIRRVRSFRFTSANLASCRAGWSSSAKPDFFVPAIRPPSVPEGESLLRLSLCRHHTAEMVEALLCQLDGMR